MTIDLSSSTDPEISLATTVLGQINQLMVANGIDFLVVGATARNITSIGLFNSVPGRATRDVDITVAVPTWDEVRRLRSGRQATGFPRAPARRDAGDYS